ncbi:tyrosine-protein phosphatase [Bacillus sp. KH172YL63]|uniref:tyrosine-protein phosphatase n=1 Tax=Bacillus sp. KH172YL63 TaxID=2709784 RepID=UPI0013E4D6D1|nr:CpsB/CapC family capsule biosynthesis tyrosine phosphatase [Bacillus sp. KH172YL63]BCB05666.1 tyrosine protein phosphatase [Bacillus sp. KH172YL63]
MIVDIHNHILHGVDDGPETLEESILMAEQAVDAGITHVIATPHRENGLHLNRAKPIIHQVMEFNRELQFRSIPLTVLPGMEIHLYGEVAEDLQKIDSVLLTLNETNKYVLIELPDSHYPSYTELILYKLQLVGYVPVIAHVERNEELRKKPELLYSLFQKGALFQVNAGSILGKFGKTIQKFVYELIKYNHVHVVASDAHNLRSRNFTLAESYKAIQHEFSAMYTNYFRANAIYIANGMDFSSFQPEKMRRKQRLIGFR